MFRHNTKQYPTRKNAPHHKHPPPGGGKRIKIPVVSTATAPAQSGSHQDNDEEDSTSKARTTEKLTDHAYRHTSQVAVQPSSLSTTRRSKNKQWINNHLNPETSSSSTTNNTTTAKPPPTLRGGPTHKSMGLVRVTTTTTTRNDMSLAVCPTFLRGKPCEDPLCRQRHDVPKQAAMPVCHYFLHHHGQCTNRTCPFRHVKVNPNTLDCPTFLQWGYCKDDDCRMKHERSLVHHHEKKHKNKVWKGGR